MSIKIVLALFVVSLSISSIAAQAFETKVIKIKNHILKVEIADTKAKRELGLMNRTKMAADTGMLFIFSFEKKVSFWMKNTFLDLDLAFFNKQKKLVDIVSLNGIKSVMQKQIPQYQTKKNTLYVLEVKKGWFKKNKIKIGTAFEYIPSTNKPNYKAK